jgi:hypothetical protein
MLMISICLVAPTVLANVYSSDSYTDINSEYTHIRLCPIDHSTTSAHLSTPDGTFSKLFHYAILEEQF